MITLRPGTAADVGALLALIREFCEIDRHDYDERRIRGALLPLLASTQFGFVLVAEQGEALDAYAVLTWGYSLEIGGVEAVLDEFYVRERGRGLGGTMIDEVVRLAKQFGVRRILLETERPNTRVRRLYARHGFAAEDSIWMSRIL